MTTQTPANIEFSIDTSAYNQILTPEALDFLSQLHQKFNPKRLKLLNDRDLRQQRIDGGELPDFLPQTAFIRESNWICSPIPNELKDRRVEITGPVERKMMINALNSGANVFMADLEDSNAPTFDNCLQGQINLYDAVRKTIAYTNLQTGKNYALNAQTATLMVRPRGWHLTEKHAHINGEAMSASLFDFGLYTFHNAQTLLKMGTAPYFYLPKLESHLEARLWNEVIVFAQNYLRIPQETIKVTCLIETILASFELHEIIYELRNHICGLNCGRWDYIFSYIKKFRNLKGFVLPERGQITMAVPFMTDYSLLVIQTCHRRNIHAIGGMSAFIPIKNDPEKNEIVIQKIVADKQREAQNGHDGTWVAHPGLVDAAKKIFDATMPNANQIDNKRLDVNVSAQDLIALPEGSITQEGLRMNINVCILYLESWLRGIGAAAIYNLMEDAATAEISRTQIWQWLNNNCQLDDGATINTTLVHALIEEELQKITHYVGKQNFENGKFESATHLFKQLVFSAEYKDFLTTEAYDLLSN